MGRCIFSTLICLVKPSRERIYAFPTRDYNWTVPQEMVTTQGRIRVTVTHTSGISTFDDSDSNFEIYQGVGRTYVYDELNRLIQMIYEDGRRVTYTYDASGNRITATNE